MVNLEELLTFPRRAAASYADLCPWYSRVGSNLILTIEGMVLAGFQFDGMDTDGKTDSEINRQLQLMDYCLNTLDDKSTIYSYIDRRKGFQPLESSFNNSYAKSCNDQLMENHDADYTTFKHTLFIGYKQPSVSNSVIEKIIAYADEEKNIVTATVKALGDVISGRGAVSSVKRQLGNLIESFEDLLSNFSSMASNVIRLRRLEGDGLVGELHKRFNPASLEGPVRVQKNNWFLPSRMASDTMVRSGRSIKFVGATMEKYVNVLSVIDEPELVSSLHIDALLDADAEFTLCQTFQIIETDTAKKLVQAAEMYYKSEVKDVVTRLVERLSGQVIDKENTGFKVLADQAQDALVDITTNNIQHGFHSTRLLIYANSPDELKADTGKVASKLRINGYTLTPETTGLFGAFLSTLPGNGKVNPRKYLASVEKVSDLMPMRGKYEGEPRHELFSNKLGREVPCHILFNTYGNIPYQFNFHVGDVGHTLVVGGTGAGKTTLINLAITEHQKYAPCKTYIFDKDYSMSVATLLLGGKHVDGGRPNALGTNPIKRFLKDGDLKTANRWVIILLESAGERLKTEQKELVGTAMVKTNSSGESNWNLSSVYTYIRGIDQVLANKLAPYIDLSDGYSESGKGIFSGYFDADEDVFELSDIMCLECSKIINIPEVSSAFLFYVTHCIEQSLDGTTPTLIYIEECWHYFKNQAFADILEDWARTLRKKCAFLILVTQGAKEFESIPCGDVLVNMSPTKIFLPLITSMSEKEVTRYKTTFGVNDEQFSMIENAIPKRDYVIFQPGITKVVVSVMPELTLASNDASAMEAARNRAFALADQDGVNWRKTYIKDVLNVDI